MRIIRQNLLVSSSLPAVLACLAALLLLIQGCAILKPYNPPGPDLQEQVEIPGFPGVRAWADEPSEALKQRAIESLEQEKAANQGVLAPVAYGLALSGGGQEGAFGAGILCGWTQSGKRPKFKLVTGISTGSLMAPFAFLGSDYDQTLREAYTKVSDKDIFRGYNPLLILLSVVNINPLPSLASSKPLQQLVANLVDATVLAKIAQSRGYHWSKYPPDFDPRKYGQEPASTVAPKKGAAIRSGPN